MPRWGCESRIASACAPPVVALVGAAGRDGELECRAGALVADLDDRDQALVRDGVVEAISVDRVLGRLRGQRAAAGIAHHDDLATRGDHAALESPRPGAGG